MRESKAFADIKMISARAFLIPGYAREAVSGRSFYIPVYARKITSVILKKYIENKI